MNGGVNVFSGVPLPRRTFLTSAFLSIARSSAVRTFGSDAGPVAVVAPIDSDCVLGPT